MCTIFTQPVLVVFVSLIVLLRQGGNAWAMVGFPFTANSNQKSSLSNRNLKYQEVAKKLMFDVRGVHGVA